MTSFEISRCEVIVSNLYGVKEIIDHLSTLMSPDYVFLESTEHSTAYRLHSLAFQSFTPGSRYLFFIEGAFLIPLILANQIDNVEEVENTLRRRIHRLDRSGTSELKEDLKCGHDALATAYFLMNQAATKWHAGDISDKQLRRSIVWLHIIDDFIESLVGRHGETNPDIGAEMNSINNIFKKELMELHGIATDAIPKKKLKAAVLKKGGYKDAADIYQAYRSQHVAE